MKKTILSIAIVFYMSLTCIAQNPKLETIWKYNIDDSGTNRLTRSDDFYLLNDSSIIFLTRQYDKNPGTNTKPASFYFSKINTDGKLIVDRKKVVLPSPDYYLKNFDITSDGNIVALAIKDKTGNSDVKTDSACLLFLNNDLTIFLQKFISSQNSKGTAPSRVTGVTALLDGKLVVGYNKREKQREQGEPLKTLSLFSCFTNNGDSLFTIQNNDPILSIEKGSNTSFFIKYDLNCDGDDSFLYASSDGSLLKKLSNIIPSGIVPMSNFSLNMNVEQFLLVTCKKDLTNSFTFDGPNDFSLQFTDTKLNYRETKLYKNVILFKGAAMQLIKDKEKGLYVFQYLKAGTSIPSDYFAFCRLDSTGRDTWWFLSNKPLEFAGGIPGKIMPLHGDDFIGVVYTNTGSRLLRLKVDTKKLNRTYVTRFGVLETQPGDQSSKSLTARIAANPTRNSFVISINSADNGKISLSVTDLQGRIIETREQLAANTTISLGGNYKAGIYLLHIRQQNSTQTLRLVKE